MKTWLLALCVVWLCAANSCPAQEPGVDAAPLMFVYVAKYSENLSPRIALGLEKPALKIVTFEKCVQVFADAKVDPKLADIAVQLKPDDAKTLIAAIKALGAPDARELPDALLLFTTPDNKIMDGFDMGKNNAEGNILKGGVIEFDPDAQSSVVRYLTEKLHPH